MESDQKNPNDAGEGNPQAGAEDPTEVGAGAAGAPEGAELTDPELQGEAAADPGAARVTAVGLDISGDGVPDVMMADVDGDDVPDVVILNEVAAGLQDEAMAEAELDANPDTGVSDPVYNLVSVLYHTLQGAETTAMYTDDADLTGDVELADFFAELQQQDRDRARRAKALLRRYLNQEAE
jgi:hypothetical protein